MRWVWPLAVWPGTVAIRALGTRAVARQTVARQTVVRQAVGIPTSRGVVGWSGVREACADQGAAGQRGAGGAASSGWRRPAGLAGAPVAGERAARRRRPVAALRGDGGVRAARLGAERGDRPCRRRGGEAGVRLGVQRAGAGGCRTPWSARTVPGEPGSTARAVPARGVAVLDRDRRRGRLSDEDQGGDPAGARDVDRGRRDSAGHVWAAIRRSVHRPMTVPPAGAGVHRSHQHLVRAAPTEDAFGARRSPNVMSGWWPTASSPRPYPCARDRE